MGLYTKVKGDVNYTVVGTPTINNGVVSGFSSNNYLTIQNGFSPNTSIWEFQCYIKYVAGSAKQSLIDKSTGSGGTRNFQIAINTDKTLTFYVSFDGTSKSIESTGTYTLTSNNYYYIRLKFTGTQYILSVSDDGYTWIDDITINNSNYIYGNVINIIGKIGAGTEIFNGSVDLNKTYIKIGDTVWFGTTFSKVKVNTGLTKYTVVGNPTIENGVASGFSSSNYLQLQQPFKLNANTVAEFKFKFKMTTASTANGIIGYPNGYGFHFIVPSDNKVDLFIGNGSSWTVLNGQKGTTVLSVNTDYYIKININKGNVVCSLSTDDINYNTEFNVNITLTEEYTYNLVYGRARANDQYLRGSIDLNASYIKIGDGYFWRGAYQNINAWKIQQDNFSKYYTIVDGKLTWASPDIYLESSSDNYGGDGVNAKQWINTNYIPSQGIEYEIDFTLFTSETSANNSYIMGTNCFGLEGHWNNNSNNALIYFNANYTFTMTRNERHKVAVKKQNDNYNFYLDNVLQTTFTELTITPTRNMYLFALNAYDSGRAAYASYSRIYKYKIWDNGTLLYHFVPVPKGLLIGNFVVPSNGMFDIVEQKFYGNEGTGDFAIGGIPQYYIIEGGKLIWCRDDIYLESTGTQYIDTGHHANGRTVVEGKFQFTDGTTQQRVFGADGNNSNYTGLYSMSLYINSSSKYAFSCNDGQGSWSATSVSKDMNWHTYKLGKPVNYLYLDNTQTVAISGNQNATAEHSLLVFTSYRGSDSLQLSKVKEAYFIIYQDLAVKQYLVPVPKGMLIGDKIAPSNCMFDLVTQTFFTNQGTGDFIIGGISGDYVNIGDNIVWVDNTAYLQSSGSQYIDTELKGYLDFTIEAQGTLDNTTSQVMLSRHSYKGNYFGQYSNTKKWTLGDLETASIDYLQKGEFIVKFRNMSISYIYNGTTYNQTSTNDYSDNNIYLFACNSANKYYATAKLWKCIVYNNSKLIRYFFPVNTNTVIGSFTVPAPGMWDAVTKKFYPNKGSGSFTYGKDS